MDPWGLCKYEVCEEEGLEEIPLWEDPIFLTLAGGPVRSIISWIKKASYWQYYPADNPAYESRWLTRGSEPPHALGEDAYKALNLKESMGKNPATGVRKVDVKPWEPIRGPRKVSGGTGKEYYRGWRWPKE